MNRMLSAFAPDQQFGRLSSATQQMTNETAEPVEKTEKLSILEQTEHSLIRWFVDRNLPKYRAKQVLSAIYQRRIDSFLDMSELLIWCEG